MARISDAQKRVIAEQIARENAADSLRPDEVKVGDDGSIVVDRRETFPDAEPFEIARWS